MITDSEKRLEAFEKMLRSVKEQYDSARQRKDGHIPSAYGE